MAEHLHQLRVTLLDATPPIWRRIIVPSATNLRYLHYVLQAAMGWTDSHLYEYEVGKDRYGELDQDAPATLKPAVEQRLNRIASRVGSMFVYVYDFGDEWKHSIEVEAILAAEEVRRYPVCIDGSGACPPEDFGGAFTYSLWLRKMAGGGEVDLDELEEYPGFDFDPYDFKPAAATRRLRRVETNAKYRTWD